MPDEKNIPEQTDVAKAALGTFLDIMIEVVALEFALADARLLNLGWGKFRSTRPAWRNWK